MSFQQSPKDDILATINSSNAIALTLNDISFSVPQVVNGTWREQQTAKNTAVRVTAKETSIYQGSVIQLFDRLDIGSLAFISGFKVVAYNAVSTHDLLTNIRYYTGVVFTTDDLENLAITTVNGKKMATLSAKPGSLGWVGNLSIEVIEGGLSLDSSITQPNLLGLNYPNTEAVPGTDVMGSVYLYGYDFTKYITDLINLTAGPLALADATKIMDMLKVVDISSGKTLWNVNANSTQWSLEGATIVRNGLNAPQTLPTNPAYKYVLGLRLKPSVTVPTGIMYLHYNDPFNPDEF